MTTVVTGGSGQLGTAFRTLLPDALYPPRNALDLSRPGGVVAWLEKTKPDRIINCAAYTAVDGAEADEATAHTINATAVGEMALLAASRSIPFVTFSTDYVFDGTAARPYVESDGTNPINAYGRSKRSGELLALDAHPAALVVRTSWVLSATHRNFVATILRLVRERPLRVVADQHGCPTVAADLALATLAALEAGATGLLHLTNSGPTTWFGVARAAVEMAGLDPTRIEPCTTEEYPLPAPRPENSVLGSERRSALGVDPLRPWTESLPAVVAGLLDAGLGGC
ncbi:MAG: dTDP-4-dehydrorhamnose reductase [Acidimicrobiia bacterium]